MAMALDGKATHQCGWGDRRFEADREWSKGPREKFPRDRVSIRQSNDGGKSWTLLPMKLSLRSWLTHALFTTWPPESIDTMSCDSVQVLIEYRDRWRPYDKPVLPDRESFWRARFVSDRNHWVLERLRYLDYESGADKPSR